MFRFPRFIARNSRQAAVGAPAPGDGPLPTLTAVPFTDSVNEPPVAISFAPTEEETVEAEAVAAAENHVDEVDVDGEDNSLTGREVLALAKEVRKGLYVAGIKMERSATKVSASMDKLSETGAELAVGVKDIGLAAKDLAKTSKSTGESIAASIASFVGAVWCFVAVTAFFVAVTAFFVGVIALYHLFSAFQASPVIMSMVTLFVSTLVFFIYDRLPKDISIGLMSAFEQIKKGVTPSISEPV